MFKVLTICLVAGLVLGAVAMFSSGDSGNEGLKPGDMAPDFALPGSDGRTHRLADYRGRTVVVAWFPKAFTAG
jgi:thioredoxin-dependent peroxiredoxin